MTCVSEVIAACPDEHSSEHKFESIPKGHDIALLPNFKMKNAKYCTDCRCGAQQPHTDTLVHCHALLKIHLSG